LTAAYFPYPDGYKVLKRFVHCTNSIDQVEDVLKTMPGYAFEERMGQAD
jgi:hypothetical protein